MKKKLILVFILMLLITPPIYASVNLDEINQKVCNRFEEDVVRLAAIMEELRRRKGITETRVAFGGVDTPIKSADYQITFAAEALAFQRAQKYLGKNDLRYSLEVLRDKVLRAKNEVRKTLEYED